MEIRVVASDAAPNALPCSDFIAEKRSGDVTGQEEEGTKWDEEQGEGYEGCILGDMKVIGRASVEHGRKAIIVLPGVNRLGNRVIGNINRMTRKRYKKLKGYSEDYGPILLRMHCEK